MPEPGAPLLARARARAHGLGHPWIDVEHVLLAALEEDELRRRVAGAGVDVTGLETALLGALPARLERATTGALPLAPEVKELLEVAAARVEMRGAGAPSTADVCAAALSLPRVGPLLASRGLHPGDLEGRHGPRGTA